MTLETEYEGRCSICGHSGTFSRSDARSIREAFPCPSCRFTLRWRDQAQILLDEFGQGRFESLNALVESGLLDGLDIYEPALRGPFVQRFRSLPNYVQSYFWPDRELGQTYDQGVRNEDITQLSFPDNSFDIILTSDVMEHLFDIEGAFAEINRVLKPGGLHIFTIPNDYPFPDGTEKRVAIEHGQEVPIKPERYHNSGDGSKCLVYTDYGKDIVDIIDRTGSKTSVVRRSAPIKLASQNATFVTRKLHPSTNGASGPRLALTPSQPAPRAAEPKLECPVCGSDRFEPFNGRANARCSRCRSVERNRLMWMLIDERAALQPGMRILHFSPESGLANKFLDASGDLYRPVDYDAARYPSERIKVTNFDLCHDTKAVSDNSFDLIVHSHVLEHIGCDVEDTLRELHRILAPGGQHFMSVPVRGEITQEDISPNLSPTHRIILFGQEDHYRIFGSKSLTEMLERVWGPGQHLQEPSKMFSAEALSRAGIPRVAWNGISSHSVFAYTKDA